MTRIIIAVMALIILTGCGADPMGETSRETIKADRDIGIAAEEARAAIETERIRQDGAIETERLRQNGQTDRVIVEARNKPTKWFTIAGVIIGLACLGVYAQRQYMIGQNWRAEQDHQRELERLQVTGRVKYLPSPRGNEWRMIDDTTGRLLNTVAADDVPQWALLEDNRAVSD